MKVELTPENFQKLLLKIKELRALISELRNANKFLNDEIKAYNTQNESK